MKSFMLIPALLLSVVANLAVCAELPGADSRADLAALLRQQSEIISSQTQERASSIVAQPVTPAADNLDADSGQTSAAVLTESRQPGRALQLAVLEAPLLR